MNVWQSIVVLAGSGGFLLVTTCLLHTRLQQGVRLAFIESMVVMGVLVWATTEGLGAFRAITFGGMACTWGIAACVVVSLGIRSVRHVGRERVSEELRGWMRCLDSITAAQSAVLIYMLLCAGILGIIAFTAAPNTWDSMTYHLSRVMHWQQNRSLAFYPTSIERQLSFGPGAEMIILDLQVLAGSDRLANFVQFSAMLGCVIGASLMTKQLGGGRNAQILAALATITLPMGILESTSTQNDYVVALWCMCFAILVLRQIENGVSPGLVLLSGAALGLAVVTKVTALLYVEFIGLWFAIDVCRRLKLRAWEPVITLGLVAILLATPFSIRNYGLYGNPLGITPSVETATLTNETYGVSALGSNVLRNLALQLVSPVEGLNEILRTGVQKAHDILHMDINDPRTTWNRSKFDIGFTTDENGATNPVQMLLLLASALSITGRRWGRTTIYALCLAAAAIVFCLVLKWQPYHGRLHLPFFVFAMPLLGLASERYLGGYRLHIPALILGLVALPYLFENPTRPILGRDSIFTQTRLSQYFYFPVRTNESASYDAAARIVAGAQCDRVGLVLHYDEPEYFVWVTLQQYVPDARIEHVLVKNLSGVGSGSDFRPCAIFARPPTRKEQFVYNSTSYISVFQTESFRLFLASGSESQRAQFSFLRP